MRYSLLTLATVPAVGPPPPVTANRRAHAARNRQKALKARAGRGHAGGLARLTERQWRFIHAFVEGDQDGPHAAAMAGYKGSTVVLKAAAQRLLADRMVGPEIGRRLAARRMISDPKAVLEFVSHKAIDSERDRDQLRAAELMGRAHALWQDVQVIRELPRDPVRLRELIEAEILRVLGPEGLLRLADRVRQQLANGTLRLAAPALDVTPQIVVEPQAR